MTVVRVHKNRTNTLMVSLGYDVSQDTILSDIRVGKSHESELIARWMVTPRSDGRDGRMIFTINHSVASQITHHFGYMDIKRISAGTPYSVLNGPIEVVFKDVITE